MHLVHITQPRIQLHPHGVRHGVPNIGCVQSGISSFGGGGGVGGEVSEVHVVHGLGHEAQDTLEYVSAGEGWVVAVDGGE